MYFILMFTYELDESGMKVGLLFLHIIHSNIYVIFECIICDSMGNEAHRINNLNFNIAEKYLLIFSTEKDQQYTY